MKRWLVVAMLFWIAACRPAEDGASSGSQRPAEARLPVVYAVNYPLAWMAERIGGGSVEVALPVPSGVDPAHWQPTPEMVLRYQAADLVLANGANYAGWIRFASLSPAKLVNTTHGLEDRLLPGETGSHRHGPAGAHEHGGAASHTWLDPTLAGAQARAVAEALARLVPESAAEIGQRRDRLLAELDRHDRSMDEFFSTPPRKQIFYSHPVYQYLDARYHLDGLAFAWEPDLEPDEAQWRKLEAAVDRNRITWMLWEAAPRDFVAARLRTMGIKPVVFETGANPEQQDGYDALLERNQLRLRTLRPEAAIPGSADQRPNGGD